MVRGFGENLIYTDRMTPSLNDHRAELAAGIRSGRRPLLFLDFDGTLVPITDKPFACELAPDVRATLSALAAVLPVAVVSGRQLADLGPRVGVDGIALAGNHGFEIAGPGFAFREPTAVDLAGKLAAVIGELRAAIKGVPGAWVQDKTLTATVHFRESPADRLAEVDRAVEAVTEPHRVAGRFVLRPGKDVLEVRPDVDWHKGRAVEWLTRRYAVTDALPIFIGDDLTDEDAFAALGDGVTILVGPARPTAARFRVDSPADVAMFLDWLHQIVGDQGWSASG